MNIYKLSRASLDLASRGENLFTFVGTSEARILLLERTLAASTDLTHKVVQAMFDLNTKVIELEEKLENARLYGFHRSAEDEG